jgi:nicotinate-nucleotide adenylyltransferase
MEQLGLDRLLLIPDNVPPHKELPEGSPTGSQRLEMVALATAEIDRRAEVLDIELRRTGRSYTCDTIRALHELYPEDELWLLMGSDMFLSLHTWYQPEVILSLAAVGAFSRVAGGEEDDFARQKAHLEQTFGARVETLVNPEVIEVSSTELRKALRQGSGREYLPEAVYGYILREGLYGVSCDLKHLTPEELRPIALSYLKPKRMPHVLGTETTAAALAQKYGADVTDARIAALLHDCTKKLDMDEQLALCEHYGIELDDLERRALKLLHSKTGAAIARDVFGVKDEIYSAILWHTTGKPDMTLLEKVIYLADYIEPTRDFPGVEELRRAVWEDLDKGMLMGLNDTIREMEERGNPIHEHTRMARDYLLKEGSNTVKSPKELAILAARALNDKKAKDIQVLEITDLTTLADYFVIATGASNTQINALVDNVEKMLHEQAAEEPLHREGYRGGTWVLLDYGCIAVHVFNAENRQFYDLERLWRDGRQVDLTDVLEERE